MRYGSVCSGIEAATVAWHSLGWEPAFFSEIEKFPREVLAHHYPDVPLHGDFTTIKEKEYGSIDLLVGGTPCQSFSVAGLRKGLDDDRGNLSLEFIKLAQRERPRWVVWENVPGVLSSNGGKDFGSFLGALGEIGYGFAYRVLDASGFGVCQPRRRVFVVGFYADWRRAAAVLFDRKSFTGTPKKRPKIESEGALFFRGGNRAIDREWPETLSARDYKEPQLVATENYVRKLTPLEYERLQGFPDEYTKVSHCRKQPRKQKALEFENKIRDKPRSVRSNAKRPEQCLCYMRKRNEAPSDRSLSQNWKSKGCVVSQVQHNASSLRGFELGKFGSEVSECQQIVPDGPRYKALGNSMAVPVMKWIGERIQMVESYE